MTPLNSVRWIIFDAVGTLIHADPAVHLAYYRIASRHGSKRTAAEVGQRVKEALSDARSPELATSEEGEQRYWQDVVNSVFPELADTPACFEQLWQHFARPDSWLCYADAEETLPALRDRGLQLGIASNFDKRLHSVLDGLPITLDRRFVASEIGWRKPSPLFFEQIATTCGVEPHELLMVGDDFQADAQAARAAGWQSLWLRRRNEPNPPGGTRNVRSLTELLDCVQ